MHVYICIAIKPKPYHYEIFVNLAIGIFITKHKVTIINAERKIFQNGLPYTPNKLYNNPKKRRSIKYHLVTRRLEELRLNQIPE